MSPQQEAVISLPASVFERVNDQESVGVFFALYEMATLFPVGERNAQSDRDTSRETQVGSQIVAATIDSNQELNDLENPVIIVFRLQLNSSEVVASIAHQLDVTMAFFPLLFIVLGS